MKKIFCRLLVLFIMSAVFSHNSNAQQIQHLIIDKMPARQVVPGITLAAAHGVKGTFGYFTMKKGVTVPMHSHENEQYSFILKGAVKATIGDTVFIIRKGEMVIIPANVSHSFTSLENNTIDLDFFSPARRDWIDGTADYFKK